MATDPDLLRAVLASFEAAARSFEACRILLRDIVDDIGPLEPDDLEDLDDVFAPRDCSHPEALDVTTLGDGERVYLCPDCGEQFS